MTPEEEDCALRHIRREYCRKNLAAYINRIYQETPKEEHDKWEEKTRQMYNAILALYTEYCGLNTNWYIKDRVAAIENGRPENLPDFDIFVYPDFDCLDMAVWVANMKYILELHRDVCIRGMGK